MIYALFLSMVVNAYNVSDDMQWQCGGPRAYLCYVPQRHHHHFKYAPPQPKAFRYQRGEYDLTCFQGCTLIADASGPK